jgi:hypothetical protein
VPEWLDGHGCTHRVVANQAPEFSSIPMNSSLLSDRDFIARLRPALPGLLFAVLTLLFGFGLGIVFGLNEDAIKSQLKASAVAGKDTVYRGDDAAIKAVLDKSWIYMQRAHLHAGGIGTAALGLIFLVGALGTSAGLTRAIALALGLGGLGYSVYWMWAGFRAPVLGGTGAAKESLKWLAMPTSGAVLLATIAVAVLLAGALLKGRDQAEK